jgi:L-ascorbate 6-phosphate lactonase
VIFVVVAKFAMPQASPAAHVVLDQVRAHHKGIAVWWVGNAGWLIKADDLLIGIDLDLSSEGKVQPPPIMAGELASELDVTFVTHHHGDHCNVPTIQALAAGSRTVFVLPQSCLKEMPGFTLAADRLIVPEPLHPFDASEFTWSRSTPSTGIRSLQYLPASRTLLKTLRTIAVTF